MKLQHLLDQYNDRVVGPDWFPFVGYLDSIYAELMKESTLEADERELMVAQDKLQYEYLEDRESKRTLFQRLIAAELLGQLAIDIPALERSLTFLVERASRPQADDYIVAASLSAHLMLDTGSRAKIDSIISSRTKERVANFRVP